MQQPVVSSGAGVLHDRIAQHLIQREPDWPGKNSPPERLRSPSAAELFPRASSL